MAGNPVAANLLMLVILVVGYFSYTTIIQETFPEINLDIIEIRVEYPGASPEEVEEAIVTRVEEQIAAVEGIKVITSTAAENFGIINAELKLNEDVSEVLDEIKAEVDRIITFPEEAEKPTIQELTSRQQSVQVALYGDVPEKSLKELANRVEDELTQLPELSYVQVAGARNYEIAIEVSEPQLRSYGLSLAQVASAVRLGSMDLPGGSVETVGEEILLRTKGQNYTAKDFEDIILRADPSGATVTIGDVAVVNDGFEESDLITMFEGKPAVLVGVYRTSDEQVLKVVEAVKGYTANLETNLPAGVSVAVWQDQAKVLRDRLNLLIKNGVVGLILVIIALTMFLNTRLAFWTSVGLFISFMGVFFIMQQLDVSINLLSLFAFILSLGIVVDDAIVIGENIFAERESGKSGLDAAVDGASRLGGPVIFAVLTTIAAFSPLLFVPGSAGKLFGTIPKIVISVLVLSLIEVLFILPAHLRHLKIEKEKKSNAFMSWLERVQGFVNRNLQRFIQGPLNKVLNFSTDNYGIVIATAVAIVFMSIGSIAGGFLKFSFFPEVEAENVVANLTLREGTTIGQTQALTALLETSGREAIAELQSGLAEDHPDVLQNVFVSVGGQPSGNGGPGATSAAALSQANIAEVNFQMTPAETRELSAKQFEVAWRDKVGSLPGVKSLEFSSSLISFGKPIQAELSAPNSKTLSVAVQRFKEELSEFNGVVDIDDDDDLGKREIQFELKPQARSLGVTLDDLARQVRGGFYGYEALRIQRGRDDIKVMIRLPKSERNALSDIQNFRVRTADGAELPLSEVAVAEYGYASSSIKRRNRRRVTTVSADVNLAQANATEVVTELSASVIPALKADYPGLDISFEGEQREQADSLGALARGFMLALFAIYALLAIPFRSYIQPIIIMAAIPFGIIGAVVGHLLLGFNLTILSMFGIIGLSGVVVNDSLVLIDFINQRYKDGLPMRDAIIEGGKARFRPILLTSLTTFLGVLPLILEKSLQAQFLIPMAISLGFGILFATFIIMILVPAMTMLVHDIQVRFGWIKETDDQSLVLNTQLA